MYTLTRSTISIIVSLVTIAPLVSAHNVLQLDISKPKLNPQQRQLWRRDTVSEPLSNQISLYTANISIGTPPQPLQLQLDTGSSDVWMLSSTAALCQDSGGICDGSIFDSSQSSSFTVVDQGGFGISYQDQTSARGDFFTDVLRIGPDGSETTINKQQMGLAISTDIPTGIIGIGFALDESQCSLGQSCQTFPTIVQNLVSQKIINTQAYSLWLNDLDSNTGVLLFGGVDTKKFTGELVTLPIARDAQSGDYTSFTVSWTGLTLTSPDGQQASLVPDNFVEPAILDSGTTRTLVPDNLATEIYQQLNAQYISSVQSYVAPCSLGNTTATFDFQFGGSQGAVIKVPLREMLLDVLTNEEGNTPTLDNGEPACVVGIEAADGAPILFGDTFLRSAYVVYDLDRKQVSLAQTVFDSTESDIQEITADKGIPSDSTTATFGSVVQTATGLPGLVTPSSLGRRSSTTSTSSRSSTSSPLSTTTRISTASPAKTSSPPSSSPIVSSTSSKSSTTPTSSTPIASVVPVAPSTPISPSTTLTPSAAPTLPSAPVSITPPLYTGGAAHLTVAGHSLPKLNSGPWLTIAVTTFMFLGCGLLLL